MKETQVVVGFKVPASKKREIDQTAKNLSMDISTYMRGIVMENHEKINQLSTYPEKLIFNDAEIKQLETLLGKLPQKYWNKNFKGILIAALKASIENEKRIVSNKIGNYINQKTA